MRPLAFLVARTFVNGVRRALTSPKRVIGLLFFALYYIWLFRPRGGQIAELRRESLGLEMPPIEVLNAILFTGFSVLTLILSFGIFSFRGGFKAADVDVLFPTPMSPKIVLISRMVRDTLFTLLVPLVVVILFYRPVSVGLEALFRNAPQGVSSASIVRNAFIAYLLLALGWVVMGYAVTLLFHHPGPGATVRRWAAALAFGLFAAAIVGGAAFGIYHAKSGDDMLALANSPILRVPLFLASAAASFTLAPLSGGLGAAAVGVLALVGFLAIGMIGALRQSDWLYEIAALRTWTMGDTQQLARSGDTFALMARRASKGKMKPSGPAWLRERTWTGIGALIWRELLLGWRLHLPILLLFTLLGGTLLIPTLISMPDEIKSGVSYLIAGFLVFPAFLCTLAVGQSGFMETLRRVDLVKSFPFSPTTLVMMECAGKAALGLVPAMLLAIAAIATRPAVGFHVLVALIIAAGAALLTSAAVFLVSVLFPDFEDQTQRGFRGLVMLLALAVSAFPCLLAIGFVLHIGLPLAVGAIIALAIAVAESLAAAMISGNLYAAYNPSE